MGPETNRSPMATWFTYVSQVPFIATQHGSSIKTTKLRFSGLHQHPDPDSSNSTYEAPWLDDDDNPDPSSTLQQPFGNPSTVLLKGNVNEPGSPDSLLKGGRG
jgi:hypothetical protein